MMKQPDDVSTDWQKRAELLEKLVRDLLLYLKDMSEYNYKNDRRVARLQDRAAALDIIPELDGTALHIEEKP